MSDSQVLWLALGGLLTVAVVVGVVLLVRRRRYIASLTGRGWQFDTAPPLEWVLDLHAPPFGLGLERKTDEGISGRTRAGVPFRVLEYTAVEGGPRFDARVAVLALPLPLPDLFVQPVGVRTGVRARPVEVDPGLTVRCADADYARALLSPPVRAALAAFGTAGHPVDVSVDGASLVAVGAPKEAALLEGYLELLAGVVGALDVAGLQRFTRPPAPPRFSFHGRPDWVLVGSDDSAIARYGLTTTGFGHRTEKVVQGTNGGLGVEGLVHRWKTSRTVTSTDSKGRTTTRTVTDHHSEVVAAVTLPFALPLLTLDGGWGGERVRFESEEFNDRFKLRSSSAKFASDVIHPRTMEFLTAVRPPGWRIEGRVMRFLVDSHDTETLGFCADFAHDFLARVPGFVWTDLGVRPPAFRADALGTAVAR